MVLKNLQDLFDSEGELPLAVIHEVNIFYDLGFKLNDIKKYVIDSMTRAS